MVGRGALPRLSVPCASRPLEHAAVLAPYRTLRVGAERRDRCAASWTVLARGAPRLGSVRRQMLWDRRAADSPFAKSWGRQPPAICMSEAVEHQADRGQGDHRLVVLGQPSPAAEPTER